MKQRSKNLGLAGLVLTGTLINSGCANVGAKGTVGNILSHGLVGGIGETMAESDRRNYHGRMGNAGDWNSGQRQLTEAEIAKVKLSIKSKKGQPYIYATTKNDERVWRKNKNFSVLRNYKVIRDEAETEFEPEDRIYLCFFAPLKGYANETYQIRSKIKLPDGRITKPKIMDTKMITQTRDFPFDISYMARLRLNPEINKMVGAKVKLELFTKNKKGNFKGPLDEYYFSITDGF